MSSRSRSRSSDGKVFFWRINQAGYEGAGASAERLLLSVLEAFGFSRADTATGARLLWANCFEPKLWASAGYCLINHFPRSVELSHKHRLCDTLMRRGCRFLPKSFVLPKELPQWLEHAKGGAWIFKPGRAGGGRGVQVIQCDSENQIHDAWQLLQRQKTPSVISQYVDNPLLVDGRKVDLRLYVLVTSFGESAEEMDRESSSGMKAYLFSEGLVRFCSEAFTMSPAKLTDPCVHLTNNEVNARNLQGKTALDCGNWRLSELRAWLRQRSSGAGKKSGEAELWSHLKALAWEVLDAARPVIAQEVGRLPEGSRDRCFELFGFDVLLDADLRPWLCEVNSQPSLGVGGKVDLAVDRAMLSSLFQLVRSSAVPGLAEGGHFEELASTSSADAKQPHCRAEESAEKGLEWCCGIWI
ncbi:unnamed protein product [Effrenium voratum]|nr:unnamed protein product [Effrenium voratum]